MQPAEPVATVLPSPVASFVHEPAEPSAGEDVRLLDASFDPAGAGIALRAWDFGDGATSAEPQPTHRYADDGTFMVTLRVTTGDGRIGVGSVPISVTTHDVALREIRVPAVVRAGGTADVTVVVASSRRDEIVQVELVRVREGHDGVPGAIRSATVPAQDTREISFAVSFDDVDGAAGQVRFRARATIVGAVDATPGDNERASAPIHVVRR
jgi:PKD repeat protein